MVRLGMDVARVESVGHQMIAKAGQLTSVGATAGRLIDSAASLWFGGNAVRWLEAWRANESAVRSLAHELEVMGRRLLEQAAQQADVSRATGSTVGAVSALAGAQGLAGGTSSTSWQGDDGSGWLSAADGTHGIVSLIGDVKGVHFPAAFETLGSVMGGVGIAMAGANLVGDAQAHDTGAEAGDVVDMGLGALAFVPGAAPIVVGLGAAKVFVDCTIPYSDKAQNQLLDYESERQFGVPASSMTPSQAAQLSQRYSGTFGWATMISDQMDKSASAVADSVESVVAGAGTGLAEAAGWLAGRL